MVIKHLSSGAECPPLVDGKVRIYSMRFCPYAQRAMLVASAKDIPFDVVYCDLKQKPSFLLERNREGKVPIIETPKGVIYESLIVSDYLDENYKGRVLHRTDAFDKALDRDWIQQFSEITIMFFKIISKEGNGPEFLKKLLALVDMIASFEKEIGRRNTRFFGGDEAPGMLDYMMWPWMERLPVIRMKYPDKFDFLDFKRKSPLLAKWDALMKEDKAVKEYFLSPEIHLEFIKSHIAGAPNYDLIH